jgi:hypothetical protein
MDVMLMAAFVSFFAMVVGWMVAPTSGKRPAPATETGMLMTGEAHI